MKKKFVHCIYFFVYFIFLNSSPGLAQADINKLHFESVNPLNGLPSNEVRKLYQDKDGYIWISTYNGLARYDGYNVITYNLDMDGNKQFINSFVNIVTEDNNHNLWIGTHCGLNVLNKVTGEVTKIKFPVLENGNVEGIVATKDGDIWIGCNKGLFRYRSRIGRFESYRERIGKNFGGMDIKTMIEDDRGYLWIGTWQQGLFRYSPKEDRFYKYRSLNPVNSAHVIFQDKAHNIWVGTWGYGLVRLVNPYDFRRFSFVSYTHKEGNRKSLVDNIVYAVAQDINTGKVWVGTRSGLSILNDINSSDSFESYTPGQFKWELPFNEVNTIMCSKDGLMWIGMLGGGVCRVNTHSSMFKLDRLESIKNRFFTNSVRSIFIDDDGLAWMGIMGFGFVSYDRETHKFIHCKEYPEFRNIANISTVNAIIKRKKTKEICFATWDNGVWIYNKQKKQVRLLNIEREKKLMDDCIYSLLEDHKGNLWIGTRNGICMLSAGNKLFDLKELLTDGKENVTQSPVFSMVEDRNGVIWAATNYSGVLRITDKGGRKEIKYYSPQNNLLKVQSVLSLFTDSHNRVWAGTDGGGVNVYNRDQDRFVSPFKQYNPSGNVVTNIQEDNSQNLWLTTNHGLMQLIMDQKGTLINTRSYTSSDGLQGQFFNRNASFKTESGELFFCGYNGINSFYPPKKQVNASISSLVITDLKIFNKSLRDFYIGERNKISKQTIDFSKKIVLSHSNNNFSIDFSILNYINVDQNKFAYKLDGYDTDWVYTDAQRHFAYYNNLKSGTYVFHLKGADENGLWNPNERVLIIQVLPPLWQTWWAYCLYTIAFLLVSYYIYLTVRNRIRMKQAIRFGEIKRQKIEEINHAKLQFFTNITHELMTPLTIILASIDELKQLHPDDRGAFAVINNNTIRLMRLIQQILEFRKVESGNLKLRVSKGNLTLFLSNCVDAFRPLVNKKRITITFQRDETDVWGYFDPDKLDKIIYNLLSNAAKYNRENGHIIVGLSHNSEKETVAISVKDSGEGLSKETISKLFNRFYEGDHRRFHTIGTGIGLSLTKDLVTLHKGDIGVESEVGVGTIFTVNFMVSESAYAIEQIDRTNQITSNSIFKGSEAESPEIETSDEEQSLLSENKSGLLLVEDNEELRSIMVKLLKQEYRLFTANNGVEAISVLEKEAIDLIISDIMMPEMDGLEFCRYVKNKFEFCHLPVILLTAKQTEEDIISGYQSGADGYVCKPVNLALLHAKIDNLLKKKQRMGVDFRKQLVFEAKELDYTSMDEEFIKKAIDCVYNHLGDCEFDHPQFIAEMGTSRSTMAEKLRTLTGLTPSSFIRNIRLKAACQILDEKKKVRITDLAYEVGFSDPKYFSTCFKNKFGLSPSEYMTKYGTSHE